jgi:DNA-binding MarR family transcriptional regulator
MIPATQDRRMGVDSRRSLRRLAELCEKLDAVRRQQVQLLAERDALLAHLCDSGIPRSDLAKAAGLTPGRITQLLDQVQSRGLIASDD